MSSVLIATFGSLGDIHPFMALGEELERRGHRVTIATSESYRQKITTAGLGFVAARPGLDADQTVPELMEKVMDARTGTEFLFREIIIPSLRDSYADLLEPAGASDLIISHPVAFAAPLVAEKLQKKWLSTALCPASLWSIYDPPELSPLPALGRLRSLGPGLQRAILRLARRVSASWVSDVAAFRKTLGLPPGGHPLFEGQHSPWGVLALFSPQLAQPQPDWPAHTKITGFCYYDQLGDVPMYTSQAENVQELSQFLDDGAPPFVFTLGSAAVFTAHDFYRHCVEITQTLGQRAVMLVGDRANLPAQLPPQIFVCDYAPHSKLFPCASVIVHHGGAGTTGQAMRAGKPMLVVPFSHDQPDHAARLERLGVARRLARQRFSVPRATRLLRDLLDDPHYAHRAAEMGEKVRKENGPSHAADFIEDVLRAKTSNAVE